MENSKLIQHLDLLSRLDQDNKKKELKQFKKWLESPWCNTNKNLVPLFEVLSKFYPDFNSITLTKEKLFKKAFKNKPYKENTMNGLLTDLVKQLNKFLIHSKLEEQSERVKQKDLLIASLIDHKQSVWAIENIEEEIDYTQNKKVKGVEDFYRLADLNWMKYFSLNDGEKQQPDPESLNEIGENINKYFLLKNAVLEIEKKSREQFIKRGDEVNGTNQGFLEQGLQRYDFKTLDFIKKLFDFNQGEIDVLKEQFLETHSILEDFEKGFFFNRLMNEAAQIYYKEPTKGLEHLFEIYKIGIEIELFTIGGIIREVDFCNVVTVGNLSEKFSFTEAFMENFLPKVKKELREDAYKWANADLCYNKGEFKKAFELLYNHKFKSNSFGFRSRTLILKSFFDSFLVEKKVKSLSANIDAFEMWIKRNRTLLDERKEDYFIVFKHLKRIVRVFDKPKMNIKDLEEAKNDLEDEESFFLKPWLIERIKKLLRDSTN